MCTGIFLPWVKDLNVSGQQQKNLWACPRYAIPRFPRIFTGENYFLMLISSRLQDNTMHNLDLEICNQSSQGFQKNRKKTWGFLRAKKKLQKTGFLPNEYLGKKDWCYSGGGKSIEILNVVVKFFPRHFFLMTFPNIFHSVPWCFYKGVCERQNAPS